jgi:prepilin-type N-terminal cleavage/methylation domain-containing protein
MQRRNQQIRIASGFTLIELLVVVAIIGILVSILIPAVAMARKSAKITEAKGQLSSLAAACSAYYEMHRSYPGPAGDLIEGDPTKPPAQWNPGAALKGRSAENLRGGLMGDGLTNFSTPPTSVTNMNRFYKSGTVTDAPTAAAPVYDANNVSLENVFADRFSEPKAILYFRRSGLRQVSGGTYPTGLSADAAGMGPHTAPYYRNANSVYVTGVNVVGTNFDRMWTTDSPLCKEIRENANNPGKNFAKGGFVLISAGWDGKYGYFDPKKDAGDPNQTLDTNTITDDLIQVGGS